MRAAAEQNPIDWDEVIVIPSRRRVPLPRTPAGVCPDDPADPLYIPKEEEDDDS